MFFSYEKHKTPPTKTKPDIDVEILHVSFRTNMKLEQAIFVRGLLMQVNITILNIVIPVLIFVSSTEAECHLHKGQPAGQHPHVNAIRYCNEARKSFISQ